MKNLLIIIAICSLSTAYCQKLRLRGEPYRGRGDMAIIVCPGGSYSWHDWETEGSDVARWLQEAGITAFVLDYRVQGVFPFITRSRMLIPGNQYPDALNDLRTALRYVREHAVEYGIDPDKVGAMGFSAGGHLVMSAAEYLPEEERPNFVAPIYPVVTMREKGITHKRSRRALLGEYRKHSKRMRDSLSLELHVPQNCPPVFLVNCKDDPVVDYRNSELLDSALTAQGVPHRYIQYKSGGHGFGASDTKGTAECREWRKEFINWLMH
ncbi:MAG: alpha/beta hydrolase [Prevotella sp.]|nr:alpha/beta hydrolase [Prevotella sp.]MBR4572455.1 alpha/beta hydrolase [Prevotella sp.]